MKTVSAGLTTHLANSDRTLAYCFKVERTDGTVQGFTDHDQDLILDADASGSVTYAANTLIIEDPSLPARDQVTVDKADVQAVLRSDAITDADIRAGRYDSAEVKVFLCNWADLSQGVLKLMRGQLGVIELQDNTFKVEFLSLKYIYQEQIVDLYTPRCNVELGGTLCGVTLVPTAWAAATAYAVGDIVGPATPNGYRYQVIKAGTSGPTEPTFSTTLNGTTDDPAGSPTEIVWLTLNGFQKPGTVGTVTSRKVFEVEGVTDAELAGGSPITRGYFDKGYITFTSGNNNGLSREIAGWTDSASGSPQVNSVDLFLPMPFDVTTGDTVTLTVGCDKTLQNCKEVFNNVVNFRGFPYLPGRDEVLRQKKPS